jgi:hypothetical protein
MFPARDGWCRRTLRPLAARAVFRPRVTAPGDAGETFPRSPRPASRAGRNGGSGSTARRDGAINGTRPVFRFTEPAPRTRDRQEAGRDRTPRSGASNGALAKGSVSPHSIRRSSSRSVVPTKAPVRTSATAARNVGQRDSEVPPTHILTPLRPNDFRGWHPGVPQPRPPIIRLNIVRRRHAQRLLPAMDTLTRACRPRQQYCGRLIA